MYSILTVTCDRDREQFELQCWTLSRNLEPCQFHVIVNEHNDTDWKFWFESVCRKYFVHHDVIIHRTHDLDTTFSNVNGMWRRAGLLKLYASKWINGEYVALDSKNWFVRPMKLTEFYRGHRPENQDPHDFKTFYNYCVDTYGYYRYRHHIMPYIFNSNMAKELMIEIKKNQNTLNWILGQKEPCSNNFSETILYDLYCQSLEQEQDPGQPIFYSWTLWDKGTFNYQQEWRRWLQNSSIKLLALHAPIWQRIDKIQIKQSLGFIK